VWRRRNLATVVSRRRGPCESRLGVSEQTFYRWKKQFAGLGLQELRELRSLRHENNQLKRVVADLTLDRHILQEIVRKKL